MVQTMTNLPRTDTEPPMPGMHLPALLVALGLMVLGSVVPVYLADAQGKAHHGLALLYFWSMSAGFIRGVGFVPRWWGWRWLFGGWACALSLGAALSWRWLW